MYLAAQARAPASPEERVPEAQITRAREAPRAGPRGFNHLQNDRNSLIFSPGARAREAPRAGSGRLKHSGLRYFFVEHVGNELHWVVKPLRGGVASGHN